MKRERNKLYIISVYAVLTLSTFIAFEQVCRNEFVYDDVRYITNNPHVISGITRGSIFWAFTTGHASNWHPLTWLSHMLDCQIFELNASGHHLTSLFIHVVNTLLLFLVLKRMTGAVWPSAFVAAAFALHPMHVESVAWVAERKDMLSGLFWMLTLLAYVHYVKRPNVGRYVLVLLAFVGGLMSKPMVVTLPFVLLLLDWWPLDRIARRAKGITTTNTEQQIRPVVCPRATFLHLVIEKFPLIVLSAISSVITFVVQQRGLAMENLKVGSLQVRIINSLGCYFNYVVKMIYPKGLAVLYPVPEKIMIDDAVLAVIGVTVLLVLLGRGRRWLVVGLLWYVGVLVPVIGLVRVGLQIMADRYTYLPSIGLFIIVAWGATEISTKLPRFKPVLAAACVAILVAMVVTTRIQVGYWQDNSTLYRRAVTVTKNNFMMHYNYGTILCKRGYYDEGIWHLKESVRIRPEFVSARHNICLALLKQEKFDEAIVCLTELLRFEPGYAIAYNNLGSAYLALGKYEEAIQSCKEALRLKPDLREASDNMAIALKLREQAKTNYGIKE